jgi:superfamily I DNA/RNA helicase
MPGEPPVVESDPGGRSALGEAVQLGLDIEGVQRQLSSLTQVLGELRQRQGRFLAGVDGEQRVVRVLVDMVDTGWTVLPDRRWPGTRAANIDVLLAGPGGVFVVDVKNWRDVQVADDGRLWRAQEPADYAIANLLAQAGAVRAVLIEHGLAPAEVVPLLVLARQRNKRARLGDVHVLGELDLSLDLLRRGTRLTAVQVEQVVAALESACPPAARTRPERPSRPSITPTTGRPSTPGPNVQRVAALLDVEEVWAGLIEAASAEPIEAWMTWLHPSQAKLISRTWNGPDRVRGAAGTGKTVVALHRARHLAQRGHRVLFASYVRTLGPVFAGLFTRLAPDLTDRVDFLSVHQVAMRLLRAAGRTVTVDEPGLEECWNRAWAATHHDGVLESVGQSVPYWREEVSHVIKGRGITAWEDYAELTRVGRRTPLQPTHRQAVWRLFEEYERRRTERGLIDWDDVLALALQAVRDGTAGTTPWDAVIVDEVQDVTCTGLRLLHALVGDRPDGLLLVGDGQQAIYPGGFTLTEAGISVTGRGVVLDRNYRNRADILRHALAFIGDDSFDDLDDYPVTGRGDLQAIRPGGLVVHAVADDDTSQQQALLAHLDDLTTTENARHGDTAVLVASNDEARRWHRVLTTAGIPAILLTDYDGRTIDAVKIGTFERGKGLDFAHVLIPDQDHTPAPLHPCTPAPRRHHESVDAHAERAHLERRRLYVAIVRARDTLWLGTTASPAETGG